MVFSKDYASELEENIQRLSSALKSVSKLGNVSILYFESGPHIANHCHSIGYDYIKIDIVSDYESCLKKMNENEYDIFLVDVFGENKKNAIKFISFLHKKKNHKPVIVFTDNCSRQCINECLDSGVTNFLEKKDLQELIDHNSFLKQLLSLS